MSFGLGASALVRNEQEAVQGTLATFTPLMLLSGTSGGNALGHEASCLLPAPDPSCRVHVGYDGQVLEDQHNWVYLGFGVTAS